MTESSTRLPCPYCGSLRVASYVYGLVGFDEELQRELKAERIVLGGCLGLPGMPQYRCAPCE